MHFSSTSLAPALFGLALLPLAAAVADDQHHQPEAARLLRSDEHVAGAP